MLCYYLSTPPLASTTQHRYFIRHLSSTQPLGSALRLPNPTAQGDDKRVYAPSTMLDLLRMPSSDEVLLMIAKEMSSDNPVTNLVNLYLTCHGLRGVAYEVLYHSPTIFPPRVGYGTFGGSYLVRTLFERPEFASRVRSLGVSITGIT
jgi:hypothetical protein